LLDGAGTPRGEVAERLNAPVSKTVVFQILHLAELERSTYGHRMSP
jgi:hypothetical protein